MVKPVITVRKENDGWHFVECYSNGTGKRGGIAYKDQKTAEVAGKQFANAHNFTFVSPGSVFITLVTFEIKRTIFYIPVEYHYNGKIVTIFKKNCINPFHMYARALDYSEEKKLPYEPEFYIDKAVLFSNVAQD